MGAGLSAKRAYQIQYNALKKMQRELAALGIVAAHSNGGLKGSRGNDSFLITYRRLIASNGENAFLPEVRISHGLTSPRESFTAPDSFRQAFDRLVELFAVRPSAVPQTEANESEDSPPVAFVSPTVAAAFGLEGKPGVVIVDATIWTDGSILQIRLQTQAAKDWITSNCQTESWQWLGSSCLNIDVRFANELIEGMINDGLKVIQV